MAPQRCTYSTLFSQLFFPSSSMIPNLGPDFSSQTPVTVRIPRKTQSPLSLRGPDVRSRSSSRDARLKGDLLLRDRKEREDLRLPKDHIWRTDFGRVRSVKKTQNPKRRKESSHPPLPFRGKLHSVASTSLRRDPSTLHARRPALPARPELTEPARRHVGGHHDRSMSSAES